VPRPACLAMQRNGRTRRRERWSYRSPLATHLGRALTARNGRDDAARSPERHVGLPRVEGERGTLRHTERPLPSHGLWMGPLGESRSRRSRSGRSVIVACLAAWRLAAPRMIARLPRPVRIFGRRALHARRAAASSRRWQTARPRASAQRERSAARARHRAACAVDGVELCEMIEVQLVLGKTPRTRARSPLQLQKEPRQV
jgi:hypothetical protein